jgi:hypothetical protein
MTKISSEIAEKEVAAWLKYKGVSERKAEAQKDNIDTIKEAIEDGNLTLDPETMIFTQILKFPIGEKDSIKEFKFQPRIKLNAIRQQLNNVKSTDTIGLLSAYVSALTSQPKDILLNMDTEDYKVGQAIAIFFL